MLTRTLIKELSSHVGEKLSIVGFVHAIRNQGKIAFLRIRDKSGIVQAVILKNHEQAFATTNTLTLESVVHIEGLVKHAPPVPEKIELEAETITVLSAAAPELPIPVAREKGAENVDIAKRLDWRWLDLRDANKQKIFAVWTALESGFRQALINENGFIQIYTPSIMNAPSESGAEVFEIKYFEGNAYLAQSPQFFKQMAMSAGLERVFITGPVFRAEPSFTSRHMTEFTGWDFEMSYIDSHLDVMAMEEKALVAGFTKVKEIVPELEVPTSPFPRLTLKEVKEKLAKIGIKSEKFYDLSPEEERELGQLVRQETGSDFVWVTAYPPDGRAFYHMRDENGLTKGFDLIYRGLEVTTGAQREHRVELLEKQATEKGLSTNSIGDYLNFFRYGCPPHGGVGIGPGRIIMKILGLDSVKEATFLPRDVKRIRP